MINQTIVSLGGAYVERVSNPPDVHNLQTSRSVGGGVSNGCKSNEGNVGRYKWSALGVYRRFSTLCRQNIFSNVFFSSHPCFSKFARVSYHNFRWNDKCLFLRRKIYMDVKKYILGQHRNFFSDCKRCKYDGLLLGNRLTLESGVAT